MSLLLGTFYNSQVVQLIDTNTKENVNYQVVNNWYDGTVMNDTKLDGVIYRKSKGIYYKRVVTSGINPRWFITGNDSEGIQMAVNVAIKYGLNIKSDNDFYKIDKTILIPNQPKFSKGITLDFGNSIFQMQKDIILFDSGYYNNNLLVSTNGKPSDSFMTFGIVLENFKISSLNDFILNSVALRVKDWHQGCKIKNIVSDITQTMLLSDNNYYLELDGLRSITPDITNSARFIFEGSHNLNKFSNLLGANSDIIYRFNGPVISLLFSNNSIEGGRIGIQFNSQVYNSKISDNYFENIKDVSVDVKSYASALTFSNNYINGIDQPSMSFIQYTPLPDNNILIDSDNYFESWDGKRVVKNIDNTVGYNNLTIKQKPQTSSSLSSILVDNSKVSNQINYNGVVNYKGIMRANVNNDFIVGNYSGRYTVGYNDLSGADLIKNNTSFNLTTRIKNSDTQYILVNLKVQLSDSVINIVGFIIGNSFYSIPNMVLNNDLTLQVISGNIQLNSKDFGKSVTDVKGEIRVL